MPDPPKLIAVPLLAVAVAWGAIHCMETQARAESEAPDRQAAQRGYQFLTQKAYLPADFDQSTFDRLWTVWPDSLRKQAEVATPAKRRELAFSRYGLTGRPEAPHLPLQYVVDGQGNWTMNCFACHGGKVTGKTHPGLPNSLYALETLTADVRKVKVKQRKSLSRMDVGSLIVPLGKTNGTTNAVMFGVALMAFREPDLTFDPGRARPKMVHHDMDAPPWWHFRRKSHLYADAFAEKGHRALMQFMLVQENGPEDFARWEEDFKDVYAYLQSLRPPPYPFEVDPSLAAAGERVFAEHCSECHGTYGADSHYPNLLVDWEQVRTDPVRLQALTEENRRGYHESWFAEFGAHDTREDPQGYIAPPLDGIWASAPYFHNGSTPTLWHVLHPEDRPRVWQREEDGYDPERVGLKVRTFPKLPSSIRRPDTLRTYFNTGAFGKRADGHDFPSALDENERRAVLEYLKTL